MSLIYSKYFTTHTDSEDDRVLRSDEVFKAYRNYCRKQQVADKNRVRTKRDFHQLLNSTCKALAQLIEEKKSGVYIRRFGYFFVFRSQGHTYSKNRYGKNYYHMARNGLRSRIIFIAEDTDFNMQFWTFENRFMRSVQVAVTNKANDGFPYTGLPYTIKQLVGKTINSIYKSYPKINEDVTH